MDGRDFIALAGKLSATLRGDEPEYRTAVSRAYYGAFHVARAFLAELGFRPLQNANVHAFVQRILNGSGHREAGRAADDLRDLQSARNRADYDLGDNEVGTREYAMFSVERAHRIVSALDDCRREDARGTIRQGIAEYEKRIRSR